MKFFRAKNFLVFFIGILLIIFFVFFQSQIKNIVYSFSSPIQKFVWNIGREISGFGGIIFDYKKIKEENQKLIIENQQLLNNLSLLGHLEEENKILREALEIGLKEDFKLELVEIFGKDFFQDYVLVNKGENDGVKKDFPLINEQRVLFGKVDKVYKNFSYVSLISNQNNTFDVKVQGKEIFAVAKGRGNLNMFIDLIPLETGIREGDVFVTSALGEYFPKGLLVGKIEKVIKEDIKPFQKAEITPFFDIKTTDNLFIILDF